MSQATQAPCAVLITGASSGLGSALALHYAKPGVTLHLCGRDIARLDAVRDTCVMRGAAVLPRVLDVRDRAAMRAWIESVGRLDIVIANAGVSAGTLGAQVEQDEQIRMIFATNLDGMLNTVLPAIAVMARQTAATDGMRGRIGVVASVASFLAAPTAPSYCASKAAVHAWTVASAPAARKQGITMTTYCPGYIRTNMTAQNDFAMPGMMEPQHAAAMMAYAIARGRLRCSAPLWLVTIGKLINLLPAPLANRLLTRAAGDRPNATP